MITLNHLINLKNNRVIKTHLENLFKRKHSILKEIPEFSVIKSQVKRGKGEIQERIMGR
jgi:hypothetical protein